jgi:hypothetical protein
MPTTQYSQEKKSKLGVIITTILLIASLAFAGYVWYTRFYTKNTEIKNLVQSAQKQKPDKPDSTIKTIQDPTGESITDILKRANIDLGFINAQNILEIQQNLPITAIDKTKTDLTNIQQRPTLQGLVPAPKTADQKNLLVWEKYGIKVPIQNASFQDIYQAKSDGTVDFAKFIDNNPTSSPVQQLLTKGIVHLPFSPRPGEVGNSYIIGHSSNYITVKSDFNKVFEPIENAQTGEEFIIFDHKGRALTFKVFESVAVPEEDVKEAYKNMGDKRVVSLQGSILETVNGQVLPTKRRIVRAELLVK